MTPAGKPLAVIKYVSLAGFFPLAKYDPSGNVLSDTPSSDTRASAFKTVQGACVASQASRSESNSGVFWSIKPCTEEIF